MGEGRVTLKGMGMHLPCETMQRVVILGSGGAGKSTLARRLGLATGLPVIHLDAEYWQPGWIEPERDQWDQRVSELAAGEQWIMDGNFSRTLDVRLRACDTIIFLDVPRLLCLQRVIRRWWRNRGQVRDDMAPECPEKIDWEF